MVPTSSPAECIRIVLDHLNRFKCEDLLLLTAGLAVSLPRQADIVRGLVERGARYKMSRAMSTDSKVVLNLKLNVEAIHVARDATKNAQLEVLKLNQ